VTTAAVSSRASFRGRGIVYGSSISTLAQASIAQIMIDASAVRAAAPFYRGQIMGGVLRAETDALFCDRRRV
jgi:hypothetical protein